MYGNKGVAAHVNIISAKKMFRKMGKNAHYYHDDLLACLYSYYGKCLCECWIIHCNLFVCIIIRIVTSGTDRQSTIEALNESKAILLE